MPNPVELKAPSDTLLYQFDWTPQMGANVTLQSVLHIVAPPLAITEELVDTSTGQSLVRLSGGDHGGVYVVGADGTLSTGEIVRGQFTLRVMQPAI